MNVETLKRKSRSTHRDWLLYRLGDVPLAEPVDAESLKRAMLRTGTRGKFVVASRGRTSLVGWRQAVIMRRNALAGHY